MIAWVHQIHAAGGGKWLDHGDGFVRRLCLEKGEREEKVVCVAYVVGFND